ncbi:MAG TPA: 3,4-dihydroxyphenylacetate 2,3-dioxygenase [Symbiobacteriaceae bacterium]|jgi:3,4-dihydroxyphenylacetate 2,3-dioxygenase
MTAIDIIRSAHVELKVTDLARSRAWYVDLLGFNVTEEDQEAIYLRGIEERCHHSLVLRKAPQPAVGHISFRVAGPDDLALIERLHRGHDLPARRLDPGTEVGQGRALRVRDPLGMPVEYYAEMDWVEPLMQKFHLHRGPGIQRFDHLNCGVPDVQKAYDWYTRQLGFRCSEYTDTDEGEQSKLWAAWLFRKPNVHDLALMNSTGPRLHHFAFWVENALSLIKACDILAAAGYGGSIERGPGRHGLSNAMFLYLRDPDGHRLELYTSDYLTADPDLPPIRWSVNDKRRQTFWGYAAPPSWFEELSTFEDPLTGGPVSMAVPLLHHRPQTATY